MGVARGPIRSAPEHSDWARALLCWRVTQGETMTASVLESRRWNGEEGTEVLDVLARSDTPALATDIGGHIIFWNSAAERLLDRPKNQVLGRRCYDVLGGKDVFGNRFCHENCSVMAMSRKGESVNGFEICVGSVPQNEQTLNVTVMNVPGERPELGTLVHILQPIDREGRLVIAETHSKHLYLGVEPVVLRGVAEDADPVGIVVILFIRGAGDIGFLFKNERIGLKPLPLMPRSRKTAICARVTLSFGQ